MVAIHFALKAVQQLLLMMRVFGERCKQAPELEPGAARVGADFADKACVQGARVRAEPRRSCLRPTVGECIAAGGRFLTRLVESKTCMLLLLLAMRSAKGPMPR